MFLVCPSPSYGFPVAELCCEWASGNNVFWKGWWGKIMCRSLVLELPFKLKNLEGEVGAVRVCKCLHDSK